MLKRTLWILVGSLLVFAICFALAITLAVTMAARAAQRLTLTGQMSEKLKAEAGNLVEEVNGLVQTVTLANEPACTTIGYRASPAAMSSCCTESGILVILRRVTDKQNTLELSLLARQGMTFVLQSKRSMQFETVSAPRLTANDQFVCVISGWQCAVGKLVVEPGTVCCSEPEFYQLATPSNRLLRTFITETNLVCMSDYQLHSLTLASRQTGFANLALGFHILALSATTMAVQTPDREVQLESIVPGSGPGPSFRYDNDTNVGFVSDSHLVFLQDSALVRSDGAVLGPTDIEQILVSGKFVLCKSRSGGHWLVSADGPRAKSIGYFPDLPPGTNQMVHVAGDVFAFVSIECVALYGAMPRYPLKGEFSGVVSEAKKNQKTVIVTTGRLQLPRPKDVLIQPERTNQESPLLWTPGTFVLHDSVSRSLIVSTDIGDPETRNIVAFIDSKGAVAVRPGARLIGAK